MNMRLAIGIWNLDFEHETLGFGILTRNILVLNMRRGFRNLDLALNVTWVLET